MKVIFLDIDGALNSVDYMNALHFNFLSKVHTGEESFPMSHDVTNDEYGQYFDQRCVIHLESIINFTNAKIVISSTWRGQGFKRMKNLWDWRNLPGEVIGITPRLNRHRGEEIEEYLIQNDDITNYVIIDDGSDMLLEQQLNFVQTNGKFGITFNDAEKAIKILNDENS
tara:strand:- start:292 stop:798 length:507 start_codon:yes stop_codon:yes gene_type:complete